MTDYTAFATVNAVMRQLRQSDASALDLPATVDGIITQAHADEIEFIKELIREVSSKVRHATGRTFTPYTATKVYRPRRDARGQSVIVTDDDLLTVTSISDNGTALSATDYTTHPANDYPRSLIVFDRGVLSGTSDPREYVSVTGTWGYHKSPNAMYMQITTLDANIASTTATTFTVTDASRFEILQYIRVNTEVMEVQAVNTATDTLTVTRGALGSTATTHTSGDGVATLGIHPEIGMLTRRLVVKLYLNRAENGDLVAFDGGLRINTETFDVSHYRRDSFGVVNNDY